MAILDMVNKPLVKAGPVTVTPLIVVLVVAVWYFLLRKK